MLIPARLSRAEEATWVATMLERLEKSEQRRRPSDAALKRKANELSAKYLDGVAKPLTVRWVDNQTTRWGSCTPSDSAIRLSSRLQGMPSWVIDYVLLHELAHLIEAGHTKKFWKLVDRYPKAERAKGFLEGVRPRLTPRLHRRRRHRHRDGERRLDEVEHGRARSSEAH